MVSNTDLLRPAAAPALSSEPQHGGTDRIPRVLYIHPGTFGPPVEPERNPFFFLSRYLMGDYVTIWLADAESCQSWGARCREALGRFTSHWMRTRSYPDGIRTLREMIYFITTALHLTRKHGRYDAVVAYGPHRTGLAGYIIARLTGSVFILELPGHPFKPYRFVGGAVARFKLAFSPLLVSFLVKRADHLRLYYPGQLAGFAEKNDAQTSVFPDLVPIRTIRAAPSSEQAPDSRPYILFLGHPWYLKGVDVLIRAFHRIANKFPELELRIIGHCPDRSAFETLRAGSERIRFDRPVPHAEAMRLMAGCSVFVLPSRTEAAARVLFEAMAVARPIVASAVDGTPHYVRHGDTGLLFESENPEDLAAQLERVLGDEELARSLGARGHAYVHEHVSEEQFAARYRAMVDRAMRGRGRDTA